MNPHPIYMARVGAIIPAIMNRRWEAIANRVRRTESTSVEELQQFFEALPGEPVPPTGDEMIDRYLVLSDFEQKRLVIGVPIELVGSDLIWLLALNLNLREAPHLTFPAWQVGLNEQRLVTCDELDEIREQCRELTPRP